MKSVQMPSVRNVFFIIFAVVFMLASTACSKKKSGKTAVGNRVAPRNTDHMAPMYNNYGQEVEWGAISHSGQNTVLTFMSGVEGLGAVGSQFNNQDGTGIRFRGSIPTTQNGQPGSGGQFAIMVWDSHAAQQGGSFYQQPFYWNLQVMSSSVTSTQATVTLADSVGELTFSGSIQGGMWQGQVSFRNNDGQQGILGQFSIVAGAIFN